MKQITIITRREKLDDVRSLLQGRFACGMTVVNVQGCGNQSGFRDAEGVRLGKDQQLEVTLMPKVQIDSVVREADADTIIDELVALLRTGRCGDGKIFVRTVENAIRIRTGERGEEALDTIWRD